MESHSILCSHAQISFEVDGEREDEHVARPPCSLCPMNSGTLWEALKAGPGAIAQINELDGERKALLSTCDARSANIKMLKSS